MTKKSDALVIGPDEGQSHWQPLPSTGWIEVKVSPYNSPFDLFSSGIQVLEPGTHVREHGHERAHEMLFIYEGRGSCLIDGVEHKLEPETTLMLPRGVHHRINNAGPGQMRMLWVIFPAGLEDWFKAIGQKRQKGDTAPPPVFARPENVTEILRQQRFLDPVR